MAQLAHITIQQAIQLANVQYAQGAVFNPIQVRGEWYISEEEVRDCVTIEWVNGLEVTEVEIPVTDLELPNENE